jgi:hypothetical protein
VEAEINSPGEAQDQQQGGQPAEQLVWQEAADGLQVLRVELR